MNEPTDRRRSPRVRFAAYAALETSGRFANDQGFGVATDVSFHGIGLRTGQPPLVGQGVLLRLAIDEEIVTLRATARHSADKGAGMFHVGLDWAGCSEAELAFLDRWLRESSATR